MLFFLLKCFSLFLNCLFVSGKGGEGGELCRTVEHRHLWMLGGYMMRMIYYFVVIHNCCFFVGLLGQLGLFGQLGQLGLLGQLGFSRVVRVVREI